MKRRYCGLLLALTEVLVLVLSGCAAPTLTPQMQPSGMVQLTWNSTAHRVTVSLHLTGLMPFGQYPAQIQSATSCRVRGPLLFELHPIEVNANGVGTSTTTIENLTPGIPRSGWIVIVQMGLALSARYPLACVVIHRLTHLPSFTLRYPIAVATPPVKRKPPEKGQGWLQASVLRGATHTP